MENVLIVIYLIVVIALIGVILLQRSEGGGLGMGSGNNGLIAAGASGNVLTRTTAILAALFFATAISLTVLSKLDNPTRSILDAVGTETPAESGTVLDALNSLQGDTPDDNSLSIPAPASAADTPAAEAGDAGLPAPEAPAPSN